MPKSKRLSRLLICITLLVAVNGCDQVDEQPTIVKEVSSEFGFGFVTLKSTSKPDSSFTVFVPLNYNEQTPSPAILFLHGAGQIGTDGEKQTQGGLADAVSKRYPSFPFITIFPQAIDGPWTSDSSDGKHAIAILDQVEQTFNIDRTRVYLTGYSMGGEGTWSLAAAHPNRFAALIPICPGANVAAIEQLKNIPCWCFQGDADSRDLVNATRKMLLEIKSAGGQPIYQEYPGVGHNCWDRAYNESDLFDWLLQHSRTQQVALNQQTIDHSKSE
jgi:predicted peptidase